MTDLKPDPMSVITNILRECPACAASKRREDRLRAALGKINDEALNNMNTYGKHPSWEFIRAVCQEALK